jgi:hypothetical protein
MREKTIPGQGRPGAKRQPPAGGALQARGGLSGSGRLGDSSRTDAQPGVAAGAEESKADEQVSGAAAPWPHKAQTMQVWALAVESTPSWAPASCA